MHGSDQGSRASTTLQRRRMICWSERKIRLSWPMFSDFRHTLSYISSVQLPERFYDCSERRYFAERARNGMDFDIRVVKLLLASSL